MKVAIVYDWIDKWGGVERILLELATLFPDGVFFTSYRNEKSTVWADNLKTKTSFIQRLPSFVKKNRVLSAPLYPFAFESFDFEGFDLVISVSSSFAKSVITRPGLRHLCYMLTPTRYLWMYPELYMSKEIRTIGSAYIKYIKAWDYASSVRPDKIVAISKTVAGRVQGIYRRQADVIYPPFDADYWHAQVKREQKVSLPFKSFYLIVSRLEPYKRIDIAIETFKNRPYSNLVVVGEGSMEKALTEKIPPNIRFLHRLTDAELAYLYKTADGLIMMQEEDFGYVSLEAQVFGCPIIAYNKGGATETANPRSSIFIDEQSVRGLENALASMHTISYNLKESALREGPKWFRSFSSKRFREEFFSSIAKMK